MRRTITSAGILLRRALPLLVVCASPVSADTYDAGIRSFERGDIATAVERMKKSLRPEAPFIIGHLAEEGKIPGCDTNCALYWYRKSLDRGYIRALTQIAVVFWNDDQKEKAIEGLTVAARFNDDTARRLLGEIGKPVPEPDLYEYQAEQIRNQQMARQQQIADQKAQQQKWIELFLTGAASYYSGRYSTAQSHSILRQTVQSNAAAVNSTLDAGSTPSAYTMICPDGSYVYGTQCVIAPDGRYVSGPPQIAPDGTYVSGQPRIAPDRNYVGGNGTITICPDGRYVAGQRCQIAHNGSYVGVP